MTRLAQAKHPHDMEWREFLEQVCMLPLDRRVIATEAAEWMAARILKSMTSKEMKP